MNGNDFMAWELRSPLHGMLSNGMMLITIEGEYMWVITSRERKWWRNLQGGATVDLLLKRKPAQGVADVELDEKSVEARMYEYLRHVPQAAKPMKICMEGGKPNPVDIAATAKDRLFVKIKLTK